MAEYLVTGGTGFIASYIIKSLLQLGHTVRTTVRNPSDQESVGFLWELKGAKERLKIFKADLTVVGSFDEAVNGVDGVFHTASPVLVPQDNNIQETLVDPIIKGTTNVMDSCAKSKTLKRIVLTSSCSSIRYRFDATEASPLNESLICSIYPKQILSQQRDHLWYGYAKTLGEKVAWRIAEEKGLNLVVVNPAFVVGPLLGPKPTSTLLMIFAIVKGLAGGYPDFTVGFVHIDDVVASHVLAMEEPEASGRIICSSSVAHWSDIIALLRNKYPNYPYENKCNNKEGDNTPHSMDTRKIQELGFASFKSVPEMFDDCIRSFQEKGLL